MRLLRFLRKSVAVGKDIDYYSKFSPSPLSMKQFLDFGKMNFRCFKYSCNLLPLSLCVCILAYGWNFKGYFKVFLKVLHVFVFLQVLKMHVRKHPSPSSDKSSL